jgi:hypothetical protein
MVDPSESSEPDWRTVVVVREDAELAGLLVDRLPPPTAPRAVSVTDLVAPRRAFWRGISPVPMGAERQQRVDTGRAIHRRLGDALSTEGALEVRVRRDGVVGRIDLLADVPVEVKTSASLVDPDALREARPDQIEQLAMYCVLADRRAGRLLTLEVADGRPTRVQAVDVELADPQVVRTEMRARAESLRRATVAERATGLPRCRWFGRGCEFQEAAVCDCAGEEPENSGTIIDQVRVGPPAQDVGERVLSRLLEIPEPSEPPTLHRFRDLLYPRRAYYERTVVERGPELPRRGRGEPPDLYARLTEAVESGPLGEVARRPSRTPEPEEEVGGFRGSPYLVRTSRGSSPASPQSLTDRQPQYALELGFRCVATGASTAYLIMGRERAGRDRDRVQVFEFRFAPATVLARVWRERSRRLAAALREKDPAQLPPCPEWMYADCPYRSDCACGASGTRSQR